MLSWLLSANSPFCYTFSGLISCRDWFKFDPVVQVNVNNPLCSECDMYALERIVAVQAGDWTILLLDLLSVRSAVTVSTRHSLCFSKEKNAGWTLIIICKGGSVLHDWVQRFQVGGLIHELTWEAVFCLVCCHDLSQPSHTEGSFHTVVDSPFLPFISVSLWKYLRGETLVTYKWGKVK